MDLVNAANWGSFILFLRGRPSHHYTWSTTDPGYTYRLSTADKALNENVRQMEGQPWPSELTSTVAEQKQCLSKSGSMHRISLRSKACREMQPSVAASDKQVCANSTKCYKEMLCVLTQEDNWRRSFCKTGQAGAEGKRPVKRYLKDKMISPVTSLLAALVEGKLLKLVCEQMSR